MVKAVGLVWLALVALAGCKAPTLVAPTPAVRCGTLPPAAGFMAGFGRADITPPAGAGMLGYGPESRVGRGYRQRLTTRTMALQDAAGERIILGVADLDFIPGVLHRAVAARIEHCFSLGADRIILSATHTHSGPGHFAAHRAYDSFGTAREGFDPGLLHFLADSIAQAMIDALLAMRPARAGWGQAPVWQVSRIRSWAAHAADLHPLPSSWPIPGELADSAPLSHVDPTLTVFRVDTAAGGGYLPAGAWAVFAIHGTGIPAPNDLYDADLHGVAAAELERGIDALNRRSVTGPRPAAIAGFANSAEGDVLPNTRYFERQCGVPLLRRELRPGSWRSPQGGEFYQNRPGYDGRACLDSGIVDTRAVGQRLGQAAVALFTALGDSLRNDLPIARLFRTIPLRGPDAPLGLCSRPLSGTATLAGAETRETRFVGFRWFGLIPSGIEQGGHAVRWTDDCFSPKRTPRLVQSALTGEHAFEEAAQFTVARIGDVLLGTVPFEATTTTGARMRSAMKGAAGPGPTRAVLIGLANNYLSYVPTRLEYQTQHYEGGSALYGPASAEVYTSELAELTRELALAGWRSPHVSVPAFPIFPGPGALIVEFPKGPAPTRQPGKLGFRMDGKHPVLHWRDLRSEWIVPRVPNVVVLERQVNDAWVPYRWDGSLELEVRQLRTRKNGQADWEARWIRSDEVGTFRFRLVGTSASLTFQLP